MNGEPRTENEKIANFSVVRARFIVHHSCLVPVFPVVPSPMRPIRYGVIGLGWFGEKHAEVAAQLPGVELHAVCTRNDARRRAIAKRLGVPRAYADYRELLADPAVDAVSVVTHVDDHAAPAIAALRAGEHVVHQTAM